MGGVFCLVGLEERMKCYYHPQIEAVATCASCGKAICKACTVEVAGRTVCQHCLAMGRANRFLAMGRANQFQAKSVKTTNTLAIVSLVLGVLGLCGGLPFSVAAWVIGNKALKQRYSDLDQEGVQIANAGKWLGVTGTILWSVAVLCYLGMFVISLMQP